MDTTETTPNFNFGSSLDPDSIYGYLRSFLVGRTGSEFLQECYGLQEAYEEFDDGQFSELPEAQQKAVIQARKLISKLIGLATAQGFQFGMASRVIAHGYPGVVVETHEHDEYLAGMVTVRLESGEIIVPRSELISA